MAVSLLPSKPITSKEEIKKDYTFPRGSLCYICKLGYDTEIQTKIVLP